MEEGTPPEAAALWAMKKRAVFKRAEELGVSEADLDEAIEAADPKAAVIALILAHRMPLPAMPPTGAATGAPPPPPVPPLGGTEGGGEGGDGGSVIAEGDGDGDGGRGHECVCGEPELVPGAPQEWIQCACCASWQHLQCAGFASHDEADAAESAVGGAPFRCAFCEQRATSAAAAQAEEREEEGGGGGALLPSGATLIVCPHAIKQQWLDEVARHTRGALRVTVYRSVKATLAAAKAVKTAEEGGRRRRLGCEGLRRWRRQRGAAAST